MFGGLKKSASRLALVAAAGVLSTNAYAADLGGDCCADLEERVAELEATTARKGTRKTSLEVWGQVNKIIVAWNDGINRNAVLATDNVNASTRFGFRGNAKITPGLTAGYSIVIEQATGGRSSNLSQGADKAPGSGIVATATGFNTAYTANDAGVSMREANWWIESSSVGRLTVGRFVAGAGPQGTIDLGGIGLTVASGSMSLIGSGLAFRTNSAASTNAFNPSFTGYTVANTTDNGAEYSTRQNGVMWASPVLAGFTLTASLAGTTQQDGIFTNAAGTALSGTGPLWAVGLKYAAEFSGVRVAAAFGHEDAVNENFTSLVTINGTSVRPHSTNDGGSLSLMHVATGLFAQGHYNVYTRGHDLFTAAGAPSTFATTYNTKDTARQYLVQGGITKNWFGLGNTSLYGEYGRTNNGFNTFGQERAGTSAIPGTAPALPFVPGFAGDNTTQKLWGLGVVQNIDAAAMELFAGYRHFSLSSDNCALMGGCKDIGMFTTGARIRF